MRSFYHIGCDFGIYSDVGLSVVYGDYDSSHKLTVDLNEVGIIVEDNTPFIEFDNTFEGFNRLKHHYHALRATLDFSLGVEWRTCLNCCNQGEAFVRVGWENHVYFDQNAFLTLIQNESLSDMSFIFENRGNLYLYGLTVTAGVFF